MSYTENGDRELSQFTVFERIRPIQNNLLPDFCSVSFCGVCNKIIVYTCDCFQSYCLTCDWPRYHRCPDGVFESVLLFIDNKAYKNKPFFQFSIKDGIVIDVIPDISFFHYYHDHYNKLNGIYIIFENLSKLNFYPIKRKEN